MDAHGLTMAGRGWACPECRTSTARRPRNGNCPFCGAHSHCRPGRLCECGEYQPTAAETRAQERIDAEAELAYFEHDSRLYV